MTKINLDKLQIAITNNISVAGVLKELEMSISTGNYRSFYKYVKNNNLDTSHFRGQSHLQGKSNVTKKTLSLNDILVKDSDYCGIAVLKTRLLRQNLLKYECYECKLTDWNGKKISLQLDHINGIYNDHRLENLRLLCPNCHSQTETFSGKNKKYKEKPKSTIINYYSKCMFCQELVRQKDTNICLECYLKNQPTKISWSNNDELLLMIEQSNMFQVSKKLGVSSNAIKKRLKNRGLI